VARVGAGEFKPNVDTNENLIALGGNEPNVSAGATTSSSTRPEKAPMCCS
jgi:hypothetical protein